MTAAMPAMVRRRDASVVHGESRRRVSAPLIVVLAALIALMVDVATKVSLGPLSLSGVITLAVCALLVSTSPLLLGHGLAARLPWPLLAFYLYAIVRFAVAPSSDGLQFVAVMTIFALGMAFAARQVDAEQAGYSLIVLMAVGMALCGVFLVQLVTATPIYITRGFALTALIPLAASIAIPRSSRVWQRIAPFFILFTIVVSLSRTASVIAVLMMTGLVLRFHRGVRLLLALLGLAGAAGGAWLLIMLYPPLRDRFVGGDNAFEIGGIGFNTSGRSALWESVINDAANSPWFGRGAGSSVELVTALFSPITQPHNEYLRLYHDFGAIGLTCFVLGVIALIVTLGRRAATSDDPVQWAALIALLGVLAAASTDNVFVYPFVMLPLAILIGLALSSDATDRSRGAREPTNLAHRPLSESVRRTH